MPDGKRFSYIAVNFHPKAKIYEGCLKSTFPIIRNKTEQLQKLWKKYILHLKLFSISLHNFRKDLGTYRCGEQVFRFIYGIPQCPNLRTTYCIRFQLEHQSENNDYRVVMASVEKIWYPYFFIIFLCNVAIRKGG